MRSRWIFAVVLGAALALAVGVHAQQRPSRDTPSAPPLIGTATIAGTVSATDERESKPIFRAQVLIIGIDNGYVKTAESDEHGAFSFAKLPAGRYLIGATKEPFLDAAYGARRPGSPGTAISVADGQRVTNIAMTMIRGGVITGIITDDRGSPVPNATARLLPVEMRNGERVVGAVSPLGLPLNLLLSNGTMGRSDERGIYRLYGVPPGDYVVVVPLLPNGPGEVRAMTAEEIQAGLQAVRESNRAGGPPPVIGPPVPMPPPSRGGPAMPPSGPPAPSLPAQGQTMGSAPIYFPGTADVTEAGIVSVAAGAERGGVDIRTRLVPTARLSGLVMAPFGTAGTNIHISLQPTNRSSMPGMPGPMQNSVRSAADGSFTMYAVPPGRYTLTAQTAPVAAGRRGSAPDQSTADPAASPQQLWASLDVVVTGQDLSGLMLTLQPGMSISGTVVFHSTRVPVPKDPTVLVSTRAPELLQNIFTAFQGGAAMKSDKTFAIPGLAPGRYLLSAILQPDQDRFSDMLAWTIESVTIDGRDVTDLPVDLKPGDQIDNAVVTLTDTKQEVFGTLKDATGRPVAGYTVLLFSTDSKYWLTGSRRVVTTRPATDGRFELAGPQGLPAGTYFLAAVTDIGPSEQYDAKLLEEISKTAAKVTVGPGERKQQEMRIK